MGVLRPLGLDIHLARTCARCIGSTVRPWRDSTSSGDRGTDCGAGRRLPPDPKVSTGSKPHRGRRPRVCGRIYQELGMWKEAGEVRRIGRRQIVTQVHVNVNDLVDRVRKAGIATDLHLSHVRRAHPHHRRDDARDPAELPILRLRGPDHRSRRLLDQSGRLPIDRSFLGRWLDR